MKAVGETVGTVRHLPFTWHLCCGAGSTSTAQLCDYASYICVTHKIKPDIDL